MLSIKNIGTIAGPVLFIIVLLLDFEGLEPAGKAVLASTLWVVAWWITEAVPIATTSLVPVVLFPLTGALDIKTTTTTYYSPMIMLFLGGFIIALAIEQWNLHKRIALHILRLVGTQRDRIIIGFMAATAFLSMWISNTSTVLMMLPIAVAIIKELEDWQQEKGTGQFEKVIVLAIAYSASIGGLATLIGTPTNAVFSAVIKQLYGEEISFWQWMSFGLPLCLILLAGCWYYLVKLVMKSNFSNGQANSEVINKQIKALGPMSKAEIRVTIVFSLVALCWILRSFVLSKFIPGIDDTVIPIAGALLLFVVPAQNKDKLMSWDDAKRVPFGVLLLFGCGLAIAAGFKSSGLADWLGHKATSLDQFDLIIILFALILLVNFLTEIISNVATASVFLPVLASFSETINVDPMILMTGATLASSCAFMLPAATPPNTIVYSSGRVRIKEMIRLGFWMNIISSVVILLLVYFLLPLIWGIS
ncbi:MAG: SLC13 family permease [Bacteroidota bacterium]